MLKQSRSSRPFSAGTLSPTSWPRCRLGMLRPGLRRCGHGMNGCPRARAAVIISPTTASMARSASWCAMLDLCDVCIAAGHLSPTRGGDADHLLAELLATCAVPVSPRSWRRCRRPRAVRNSGLSTWLPSGHSVIRSNTRGSKGSIDSASGRVPTHIIRARLALPRKQISTLG